MAQFDLECHVKIAVEKREGALDEFKKGRFTNVGDLAFKAVEQAIEAVASKEGLHFHVKPRSAHLERSKWFKANFPNLAEKFDLLWTIYHELGYGGINGERAKEAVNAMENIFDEIEKRTDIRIK